MTDTSPLIVQRHIAVDGANFTTNDVIFIGQPNEAMTNVVFFGGDVQDYPELMSAHRDNHRFLDWNLEATGRLIHQRFSSSPSINTPVHVWLVRPCRKLLATFSYYDNFVQFDSDGLPDFTASDEENSGGGGNSRALSQLEALLTGVCARQNDLLEGWTVCGWLNKPLTLVGFSKGCVVLNQIVTELGGPTAAPSPLLTALSDLYWLDSGHNGTSMIWPCEEALLRAAFVTSPSRCCHVYATPYQVEDPMRRWNGKEFRKMLSALTRVGVRFTGSVLLSAEEPSLSNHFNILKCFPIKRLNTG